jgi:hypothetical protein
MSYLFFLDEYQKQWRSEASCKDVDVNQFFPVDSSNRMIYSKETSEVINQTVSICDSCPVAVNCLRDALENDMEGIWAGLSQSYRRYLMKNVFKDDPFKIDNNVLSKFLSFLKTVSVRSRFRFKYTPEFLGDLLNESV